MGNSIELLSPAGSYESFRAALGAGADAVYAGGGLFGARAYAHNFTAPELLKAIREAHVLGRKLYLTVNTLLKNTEIEGKLYDYLRPFYEEGLDAVLVQDFGVLSFIREYFPELPVHASTQMTVTGPAGMRFLEKNGVVRVVPARELSLEELKRMHALSPLEIETFIHGALCYCYSGRCLMSSMFGGRSGNRGKCAQPCRLPFKTDQTGRETCLLSMKDLCGADLIPELVETGIASLKIEGRMKQPEYVAGVTRVYRECIDRCLQDGAENYRVYPEERQLLKDLFSRGGFTDGYYHRHNGKEMMSFQNEKKTVPREVAVMEPKLPVQALAVFRKDQTAQISLRSGSMTCTVRGALVQAAATMPLKMEKVREQILQTGNTPFTITELDLQMDDDAFLPVKEIKKIRRDALEKLEESLEGIYRRTCGSMPSELPAEFPKRRNGKAEQEKVRFHIFCRDYAAARLLADHGMEEVRSFYLPFDVMKQFMQEGYAGKYDLYLAMPEITRGALPEKFMRMAEQWICGGMRGFLVKDLEAFALLSEKGYQKNAVLDASLYTWNDRSAEFFLSQGVQRITAPLELNGKELMHRNTFRSEMMIYGYQPLMISAQCVRKNCSGCTGREGLVTMTDRTRRKFPVLCVCDPWKTGNTPPGSLCYNIIYNTLPLGLFKDAEKVLRTGITDLRMDFTVETPGEALDLLQKAKTCFCEGGDVEYPADRPGGRRDRGKSSGDLTEFTGGHFNRGAE